MRRAITGKIEYGEANRPGKASGLVSQPDSSAHNALPPSWVQVYKTRLAAPLPSTSGKPPKKASPMFCGGWNCRNIAQYLMRSPPPLCATPRDLTTLAQLSIPPIDFTFIQVAQRKKYQWLSDCGTGCLRPRCAPSTINWGMSNNRWWGAGFSKWPFTLQFSAWGQRDAKTWMNETPDPTLGPAHFLPSVTSRLCHVVVGQQSRPLGSAQFGQIQAGASHVGFLPHIVAVFYIGG